MRRLAVTLLLLAATGGMTRLGAEGVAPSAAKLVDFGHGWAITNSMATSWAVSLALVALIAWLVGNLFLRISFEIILVMFKINDGIQDLVRRGQ